MTAAQSAVMVFPDLTALSRSAADFLATLAGRCSAARNRFSIALSGGSTPRLLYSFLASAPWRESMPWRATHVFWADERCVPPDHEDSNYKLASDAFLSRVPIPLANILRIRGVDGPDLASRSYENDLLRFFGNQTPTIDLAVLGVGEDGHTASLFPGVAALQETKHLALPVHLDPPMHSRVTLALSVLNSAEQVLFLAGGLAKARIVREVIEGANDNRYPAGLVRPVRGNLTWMLDRDAASLLLRSRAAAE